MQGRPPHLPASTVIRLRRSRFIEFALFFTIRNLPSKGKRAATGRAVGTSLTRGGSWVPHSFGLLAKGAGFDFSCIFLHARFSGFSTLPPAIHSIYRTYSFLDKVYSAVII